MLREAEFYRSDEKGVQCLLCPWRCRIPESEYGFCKVRTVKEGKLYTEIYGEVSSSWKDPIEKKPLYHFYPGSTAFSIGTVGCNLACDFCQNYRISQGKCATREFSPEDIVGMARDTQGIAFTYNEPTIWYEFVYDTARLAKETGLYTVMVTNGYINEEPLKKLIPFIDAFNIDVKGDKTFYKNLCHAPYYDVLTSVKTVFTAGKHVETTTLIIPGWNDTKEQIERICTDIYEISPEIPVHFNRFFPHYKMRDKKHTSIDSLEMAEETAREVGLHYIYLGNVGHPDITSCPSCGKTLIKRYGFALLENTVKDGRCSCGKKIYLRG